MRRQGSSAEDLPEGQLATRARAGDPEALRLLVRTEGPRVAGLLVRLLGPRGDLEDLVQNVFLETCRVLPRFRGESSLSTFIGGITVRVARRAMRASAYDRHRADWPEIEPSAQGEDHETQALARERLRRLHGLVEALAPKKRVAFLLWAVEGHEPHEIAKLMGCTLYTARARVYHAKRELRRAAENDAYLKELLEEDVS